MTIGEEERALGHLETARAAAERMGARPMVVLTALEAAEVLARRDAPGDWQRGRALVGRVLDDPVAARMEGSLARATDLRKRFDDAADAAGSSRQRQGRLHHEQDVWLLGYEGRSLHLPDAKGLHHLATLLASPGTPVASLALAGEPAGAMGAAGSLRSAREGAAELQEELAEAQAFNDPERIASARAQIESLAAKLTATVEARGAVEERARINVTRAIKATLKRIAEHEPELGHLLQRTIRTGNACRYDPDPGLPLDWDVRV
jgi:hypothetical protein